MTARRGVDLPPSLRDAAGRRLCRWCREPVTGRRRSWCGQACVDAYLAQASQAGAREAVRRRDHGVCALCQFDCLALEAYLSEIRDVFSWERVKARLAYWGARELEGIGSRIFRSIWEADHIIPLSEGGGLGLDNLRTLCLWCHRAETAQLARRLGLRRRRQAVLPGVSA